MIPDSSASPAFTKAASLITSAISAHAFPAAVIEVGSQQRIHWTQAFGRLTYLPESPPATTDSIFDLASLTKVIATATLAMRAIDAGVLSLDDKIAVRLSMWRGPDREEVTIRDLLAHSAGLTAYLPFFRDHRGRQEFERSICTLPLEYVPRSRSIYSDLGFMLLAFILEDVNGAPLAQQFDDLRLILHLEAKATSKAEGAGAATSASTAEDVLLFNPPRQLRERTAPTELDLWRGRLLQGEVHDENAWALGGAAGHAGLFGTAAPVGRFARRMLEGLAGNATFAHSRTIAEFTRRTNVPGSSRALAWDTMLPSSSCGTRLSKRAIGHTGFTGTSLWIDPELNLYIVLLTNRVHPARDKNAIQAVRGNIHDAVVEGSEVEESKEIEESKERRPGGQIKSS